MPSQEKGERGASAPWAALLSGWCVGVVVGPAEILIQGIGRTAALGRQDVLEAVLVYGILGLVAAGVLCAAERALHGRWPDGVTAFTIVGVWLVGAVGIVWLNLIYLPRSTAPLSLAGTAISLAMVALVSRFAARVARAAAVRHESHPWFARRTFAACLCLGLGGPLAAGFVSAATSTARGATIALPAPDGPNVLIVVIDALRADHLSLYGYGRRTSPALDRWAERGVVFTRAYAQAPWTKPAVATILTGLYPVSHGADTAIAALPEDVPYLPELLHRRGYRTAIVSANPFVSKVFGFGRGVDYCVGTEASPLSVLMAGHALVRLGDVLPPIHGFARAVFRLERRLRPNLRGPGGDAGTMVRSLLGWVDRDARPFFAYLHLIEPHSPYTPPPPFRYAFLPAATTLRPAMERVPTYSGVLPVDVAPVVPVADRSGMLALYDGEVLCADHWVDVLLSGLDRRGLLDHTLVVVTADHGEAFGDHGAWGHGHSLFDELIHIPLLVLGPNGLVRPGWRSAAPVRQIDLEPTILAACGVHPATNLPGRSLLAVLAGREADPPAVPVFSSLDAGGTAAWSLEEADHKVIVVKRGLEQVALAFDLGRDPRERRDLDRDPPPWVAALDRDIDRLEAQASRRAPAPAATIDDDTRPRLRSLGYLN
jgi:arylsulfatase A-like enzyme